MRKRSQLFGMVSVLMVLTAAGGCLHRQINNSRGFADTALHTGAVPVAVSIFGAELICLWPMPVSPALTSEIEDWLERKEKNGVPILGPIKGEFAPIFCMDPPSEKEIYETLKPIPHGLPFVIEVQRKGVRFSTEKLVDEVDEFRFFPLAGPCQLHHCHFRCTIWWDETYTMSWPIPWQYTDHKQEVVYIDKDHLHRCGEPGNLAPAAGPGMLSHY